jgi:pimeloyl-ACP methyl ester carboxylesterase
MKYSRNILGKILILLLFTSVNSTLFGQERNVSWLHGLGENGTTWDAMEAIFVAERNSFTNASSTSPGFPSLNGVNASSNAVSPIISPDNNSIVIGHSMGGIVARDIDLSNPGQIGGVISVGTPNNGAAISNSLANGDVDRATNFACNALLAGPSSEIPFVGILIQAITPPIICSILSEEVVVPLIGGQNNQSAMDLAVGSAVITDMAGGTSGIPQISIWGNERSPVHWRLASSMVSNNANDVELVNLAEDFRSVYNTFFIGHTSVAIATGILGSLFPPLLAATAKESFSAYQWKRGVRWFDNSEGYWNQLIDCGSTRTETITVYQSGEVDCDCLGYAGSAAWVACVNEYCDPYPVNCTQEPIHYSVEIIINGASDGFICEDSQIGPVTTEIFEARGANHFEEVIHPNVTLRIREILDDENSFFYTQ